MSNAGKENVVPNEFAHGEITNLKYGPAKVIVIQGNSPRGGHTVDLQDVASMWRSKGAANRVHSELLCYEENFECNSHSISGNIFLSAFMKAYNNHEDVVLSPDDFWMHILLELATYVNDNAEKMRNFFVNHEGSKFLQVTTHNELKESQWGEFFDLMLLEIEKNTKEGVVSALKSDFSTTGRIETILSTAVIMDSFKKYFTYGRCIPLCGIRNVLFMGTREDWVKLIDKLSNLANYDVNGKLRAYVSQLTPVLHKILDTFDGNVDTNWWNAIMNITDGSLGSGSTSYISGWILKFFLKFCRSRQVEWCDFEQKSIKVPVKIDNQITGVVKMVDLVGGFGGLNKQGHAYRPQMSYAVLCAPGKDNNSFEEDVEDEPFRISRW